MVNILLGNAQLNNDFFYYPLQLTFKILPPGPGHEDPHARPEPRPRQEEARPAQEDPSPGGAGQEEDAERADQEEDRGEQQEVQRVQAVHQAVPGLPRAGGPHAQGPQRLHALAVLLL